VLSFKVVTSTTTSIMYLSYTSNEKLSVQVTATLKDPVAHDFLDHWPYRLDDVKWPLGSGVVREVGAGGVVVALECVRAFRYVFHCYSSDFSNKRVDSLQKSMSYQPFPYTRHYR
jgi:hypothetical protein